MVDIPGVRAEVIPGRSVRGHDDRSARRGRFQCGQTRCFQRRGQHEYRASSKRRRKPGVGMIERANVPDLGAAFGENLGGIGLVPLMSEQHQRPRMPPEGADQFQLVLARLDVADIEDERPLDSKGRPEQQGILRFGKTRGRIRSLPP